VRLAGKTAIITGAARGIGLATAIRFAEEGARVALGDIDEPAGVAALPHVQKHSADSFFQLLDVTRRESVLALFDETRLRFGRIDILINNAGITADAQLLKMTEADFDRVIDINLKGVFNCTQAVAAVMVEQGYGKIVSATSVVGLYGNFGQTNYVAAKAGVIGMTKVWARELGRKGICVNAIAPGFIDTQMSRKVPEKVLNAIKEKTPLARMGTTADIANAYLFLASDEANFINGAVLSVDGGLVV
jgi:3-oxoacyl-[acyl-carrier protein] reductase